MKMPFTSKTIVAFLTVISTAGCSYQLSLMPRNSGKVYQGQAHGNGMGSGTLTVNIEGKTYSGRFVMSESGDSFGFFSTYGSRPSSGNVYTFGGTNSYKAILTSSDGSGLRCDVRGGDSGAGICMDDKGTIYDLIYGM